MTGADTKEQLQLIKREISEMLASCHFPLKKWCSNIPQILKDVPDQDKEKHFQLDNNHFIKALGLIWDPTMDYFAFYSNTQHHTKVNKRLVLSEIARFFDPLGLINSIVVSAKIFMQFLWKLQLNWDESLPQELQTQWCQFRLQLNEISKIKFPRYVALPNSEVQPNGFADASEKAYGACIYIRCKDMQNNVSINLLCAKSKVAPIRTISLPRLELCAALLLAELLQKTRATLKTPGIESFCWTDSSIALGWIRSPSFQWETFVSNRVSKIQQLTEGSSWNHIPTDLNPADLVSRGALPNDLQLSTLWFHGPQFLMSSYSSWPKQPGNLTLNLPEMKKQCFSFTSSKRCADLIKDNKFINCYHRLLLVFVYVRRYMTKIIHDIKHPASISPEELDAALKSIIRNIQRTYFAEDYKCLQQKRNVSISSRLKQLFPFIDDHGILRVGGRIKNAPVSFDAKHQMLLPHSHPFTRELIRHYHLKNLHAGCQTLLNIIRQRFWVANLKNTIRHIIHRCIICFRSRPVFAEQLMGNLPVDRLHAQRAFTITGLDYCGPVYVSSRIRGRPPSKAYIALFICFVTKATHLELVTELTTSAFLLALRRFIARRGKCSKIYSDNATNFVGAKNELLELRELFLSEPHNDIVRSMCLQDGIEWSFIPPRSPHFGGLWESAVKIAKGHLLKTVRNQNLTFEEMYTIICQIEAIMNSRPIAPTSSDPNDLIPLSPGHFLIGCPLVALNEPKPNGITFSPQKRYKLIESMQQHFWTRFYKEYINNLQQRAKWQGKSRNVKIGDLVLLKVDAVPSLKWPVGRVIEIHTGCDEQVRVVTIKTVSEIYKRAITEVCPLPLDSEDPS